MIEGLKVIVPFFSALLGAYVAVLTLGKRAEIEASMERERKKTELLVEHHRARLNAVSEVSTHILRAKGAMARAYTYSAILARGERADREKVKDIQNFDALQGEVRRRLNVAKEELNVHLTSATVSAELYGNLAQGDTSLADEVEAWVEVVYREIKGATDVEGEPRSEAVTTMIRHCRTLAEGERKAMLEEVNTLARVESDPRKHIS